MTPDQVTTAITDALNHGGETWLIGTIVALLPALWTASLILHLGRPYIVRTLRRMGLRLGADGWWMTYLILRDAVLLITLGLSLIFFQPNLVANSALPITGPLSALFLLLALAVKLWRRVDDDMTAYRLSTAFLIVGATLYYFALVFGIEGASQSYLSSLVSWLTSNSNSTVALDIMWGSLLAVIIVAGGLFMWALNRATRSMQRHFLRDQSQRPGPETAKK